MHATARALRVSVGPWCWKRCAKPDGRVPSPQPSTKPGHVHRFLAADEAKAYCVARGGVLLDVPTGIIPFSAVGTSSFGAVQGPEELAASVPGIDPLRPYPYSRSHQSLPRCWGWLPISFMVAAS